MSLYNTFTDYVGDGTTTDYALPFPYLDVNDVVVTVGGVTATFSFLSPNVVRISPAPANSAAVNVTRSTAITSARVVYGNGSSTTAQQLNKTVTQLLYAMQEAVDRSAIGIATADEALATSESVTSLATTANSNAATALTNANTALTTANANTSLVTAASAAAIAAQTAAQLAADSATVHVAADLPYDNTGSGLSAANVQQAIDLIAGVAGIIAITSDTINNVSSVAGAKVSNALETLANFINAIHAQITDLQADDANLATVARSGSYSDLSGKPALGSAAAKNLATAANIRSNSGTDPITTDQAWTAAGWVNLGNVSGSITVDCNTGSRFWGVLTGNATINFSNVKDGQVVDLALVQDATGSRTVNWNANVRFPDNIAPSVFAPANNVAVVFSGVWIAPLGVMLGAGWKIN